MQIIISFAHFENKELNFRCSLCKFSLLHSLLLLSTRGCGYFNDIWIVELVIFVSKIKVLVLSKCLYTPVNGAAGPDLTVHK